MPSLPSFHLRLSIHFDCVDLFNLQNSCRPETFLLNSVRADFLSRNEKPVCRREEQKWDIRLQVTGNETYVKIQRTGFRIGTGVFRNKGFPFVLKCRE
ncbi:hypothetical protein CEXT_232361 [Caerostris extrusa]|uniref:Uncharacterized protein n=1 Tax=Caerostris extrusa TaxID=172846 RepID=A0AAV4N9C5_CAEEX|nr:hypothetical protein CEXT_232361 [Caerostris extrusa]